MRLDWCEDNYSHHHRFTAIKVLCWSVGYLVLGSDPRKRHRHDFGVEISDTEDLDDEFLEDRSEKIICRKNKSNCQIAFITSGGLGDHLLFANYVYKFWRKYIADNRNIYIDVVFKDKYGLAENIFCRDRFIRNIFEYDFFTQFSNEYDLVIDMAGFPKIEVVDRAKLRIDYTDIFDYVAMCENYKEYCRSAFRGNAYGMSKLCELEGRKLIQRGDINSILGITEEYEYPLFIEEDEATYLKSVGLNSKEFVTIQTGVDVIYDTHVKQWPIENYIELLKLLHEEYPELMIVQVGNAGEVCGEDSDNFKSLVNKTNIEQAKVLMKHSLVHIDIEGGMVHLRHALKGGKSIVLFGPTSIDFFGYSENLNIKSDICNTTCYQMTSCWPEKCPKYDTNKCMETISANKVFEIFKDYLEGLYAKR